MLKYSSITTTRSLQKSTVVFERMRSLFGEYDSVTARRISFAFYVTMCLDEGGTRVRTHVCPPHVMSTSLCMRIYVP